MLTRYFQRTLWLLWGVVFVQLQAISEENYAHLLAIIDRGASVRANDKIVAQYEFVLSNLTLKFQSSKQKIADQSARTKELLESEAGISESVLNIMEGIYSCTPRVVGKTTYAECMATYLTLREKGYSHREAVRGLRDIFRALLN